MGIVRLLPENLINQIAAGEVVERPSSVVKELIENSIDAGATEVIVDIEDGGRKLIRVSDNGCGMIREDAILSLQRHATGKIRELKDLFNISTLGFRGEALPSIASVSRLRLTTVPSDSMYGTSIAVEGGRQLDVMDYGGAVGTAVEVRDLFFNTPARLKFMKSPATELSHITETVTRMAISYPSIRFLYKHNGSSIFNLPSSKDLLARLCKLMREEERSLLEVSFNAECGMNEPHPLTDGEGKTPAPSRGGLGRGWGHSALRITGYVSGPEINRPTQRGIYIFVNGRFVRDRVALHAIMDAYRTCMEKDRYPLVVLFIDVDPAGVDVNVHPAKTEVRFRNTDDIHRAVYAAVSEALKGWTEKKFKVQSSEFSAGAYGDTPLKQYQDRVGEAIGRYAASQGSGVRGQGSGVGAYGNTPLQLQRFPDSTVQPSSCGFFSSLNVLGRVGGTYIVCSNGRDLCLIDQHAAHERVAFERLKKSFRDPSRGGQTLLIPETVELTTSEAMLLREYVGILLRAGLETEDFGGNTFVIKAIPSALAGKDVKGLIRDIVDDLADIGRSRSMDDVMDRLFSRMACHSAVEGGDYMDPREIATLLRDLDSIDFSSNCPHGRPVFVMLSQLEIEKMFGRK
jgi:DNA mismatch repair protein MutL